MQVDYRILKKISKHFLLFVLVLLGLTLVLGVVSKGASRWIQYGFIGFQPSEFARLALIMHLSALIVRKGELVRDLWTGFAPLMFWIIIVAGLVLFQPAFSTGAMLVVVSLIMLFVGGVRWKHLLLTMSTVIPVLLVYMVSAEYRMRRVMSFVDSVLGGNDRMNHQVWQGILGFANGGLLGLGPGGSKQRELYLPESFGDFVFSIIGEEYGLIGTLAVLTLFVIILFADWRLRVMPATISAGFWRWDHGIDHDLCLCECRRDAGHSSDHRPAASVYQLRRLVDVCLVHHDRVS
jgi:cell division protein FtsW